MENLSVKRLTEIEELMSKLLTTLDEKEFFSTMVSFLSEEIDSDEITFNLISKDDNGLSQAIGREIIVNSKAIPIEFEKKIAGGVFSHVIKTMKSYYSNNVARDPLFSREQDKTIFSELCIPVIVESIIIGTIHFRRRSEYKDEFNVENINLILSILKFLKPPLKNMKMYISSKLLNESLKKKIEEKEKELEKSLHGLEVVDTFKIIDKKIIAESKVMKDILELVEKATNNDYPVLVTGGSGTGKETIAKKIHCESPRKEEAFISIDSSFLSEEDMAIEIFGKGNIKGAIETASKGTVFIKNIDKMSMKLQFKLVNFINSGIFFKVGSQRPFQSRARIIVTSKRDLDALVRKSIFREDLFFLFSTLSFKIPPLAEREEDIESLASYFLNKGRNSEDQKVMSPRVINILKNYTWPGNIRELEAMMHRAYLFSPSSIIEQEHLGNRVMIKNEDKLVKEAGAFSLDFKEITLNDLERDHICRALHHLGGNKTRTAKMLGITVKTLYNKLHCYGVIAPKNV